MAVPAKKPFKENKEKSKVEGFFIFTLIETTL